MGRRGRRAHVAGEAANRGVPLHDGSTRKRTAGAGVGGWHCRTLVFARRPPRAGQPASPLCLARISPHKTWILGCSGDRRLYLGPPTPPPSRCPHSHPPPPTHPPWPRCPSWGDGRHAKRGEPQPPRAAVGSRSSPPPLPTTIPRVGRDDPPGGRHSPAPRPWVLPRRGGRRHRGGPNRGGRGRGAGAAQKTKKAQKEKKDQRRGPPCPGRGRRARPRRRQRRPSARRGGRRRE